MTHPQVFEMDTLAGFATDLLGDDVGMENLRGKLGHYGWNADEPTSKTKCIGPAAFLGKCSPPLLYLSFGVLCLVTRRGMVSSSDIFGVKSFHAMELVHWCEDMS